MTENPDTLLDLEFETFGEKMAFLKGLTFEHTERVDVIAWAGHGDETRNKNGKYEWVLSARPRPVWMAL